MRYVQGEGPIPFDLLLGLVCQAFPAYKIEELAERDDLAMLLRVASLVGQYRAFEEAKRNEWKPTSQFLKDMMDYDLERQR